MGGRGSSSGKAGSGVKKAEKQIPTKDKQIEEFKSVLNSELSRGLPESQQKDFYYHSAEYGSRMLDDMSRSVTDKEAMESVKRNIETGNVLINIEFPQLTGSEKQVAYAKSLIRRRLWQEVDSVMDRLPRDMNKKRDAKKQFLESAKNVNPSIKTFSDAINFGLKNRKGGVLQFISKNKSASEIIDKYK